MPWMLRRVGDRNAKPVVRGGRRDRDDALQRPQRDQLRRSGRRSLLLDVVERRGRGGARASGRRPRVREPSSLQRFGERAGAGAAAGRSEPVPGDDLRRGDDLRDEIGDRLEPAAEALHDVRPSPRAIAEIRGRAKRACGLEIHANFPRTRYRQPASHLKHRGRLAMRGAAGRPVPALPESEVPVEDRATGEEGHDGPEERETEPNGIAIFRALERCRTKSTADGTSAARNPSISATVTSARASRRAGARA